MIETVLQDIKFGFRLLLKNRTLTTITVLAMALGIGASSAMFSVVNRVILRPLPFKEPDRIVKIYQTNPRLMINKSEVTGPDFLDWRQQSQSFEKLAAMFTTSFNLTGNGEPEIVWGAKVSPSFFQIFGLTPTVGRTFLPEEENPAANPVVIISTQLWKRRFNGDPNIIGKTTIINDQSVMIIGIMPENPKFPASAQLWTPLTLEGEITENRDHHNLHIYGLLKDGVSIQQAQAEISTIAQRLEQQHPITNGGVGVNTIPVYEEIVGSNKFDVLVLFSASVLVLLIACASLGNLLLARAATRRKEISIRAALGAGRARIIRQLLTESLLMALLGGALGLLLAFWGVRLLPSILPGYIPTVIALGIDYQVLVFTLIISVLTGVGFGLSPALQSSKLGLSGSLKEARGVSSSGFSLFRRHNARSLLVISELALALMLLIAAGLMFRSFLEMRKVEPGFDPHYVVSMQVYLPYSRYPAPHQISNFFERAVKNIEAQPGVESAAVISTLPLGGIDHTTRFQIEGREAATGQGYEASLHRVSLDYFKAMGIPLKNGRTFATEDITTMPVVVVNETMAHRFWPGQDPVGKRVRVIATVGPEQPWVTIIGVVGDVRHWGLGSPLKPEGYALIEHTPRPLMSVVVRTKTDPTAMVPAIKSSIRELDKDLPLQNIKTMQELLSDSVAQPRQYMFLIGSFALVALLLAAMGVYGVMSYLVTQRTQEIGIRMALGARRRDVIKLITGQGSILALGGIVIGLAGAFILTRFMASLLFGVSAFDPYTFVSIPLILTAVAFLATFIPARRATKIDPMIALRAE